MRFTITGPRGHVIGRGTLRAVLKALPAILAKFGRIRIGRIVAQAPQPLTMYDSVDLAQIPAKAKAVAGYVDGAWPTFPKLAARFPHAERLSIAVNAGADAECLDVENGDATAAQAPGWVRRQWARGVKRPVVYCSVSSAPGVLDALARNGVARAKVRLWTAHYTGKPHRCSTGSCGYACGLADATQWTKNALGRNLDASLCSPGFFGG